MHKQWVYEPHREKTKLSKMEWTVLLQPRLREWMLMNKVVKRTVPNLPRVLRWSLTKRKKTSRSHAEMFSATEIMWKQLLHQRQCLCVIVQEMGARMEGKFAEEGKKKTARTSATENRNTARKSAAENRNVCSDG